MRCVGERKMTFECHYAFSSNARAFLTHSCENLCPRLQYSEEFILLKALSQMLQDSRKSTTCHRCVSPGYDAWFVYLLPLVCRVTLNREKRNTLYNVSLSKSVLYCFVYPLLSCYYGKPAINMKDGLDERSLHP